jgi:GMP synthase-like glutamine amidotransferase
MQQVLVLQHIACETVGTIAHALAQADIPFRYVRPFAGDSIPPLMQGWAGLAVMGGPMGVYEVDRHPHLRDEIALIEDACDQNLPVLGICLGSQLLATALGARVTPGASKEIGWFKVMLRDDARTDRLFAKVPIEFMALHWHGDVFELPDQAVPLARTSKTPLQAFRWRERAYGVLFHLETTATNLDAMIETFGEELAADQIDPELIRSAAVTNLAALDEIGQSVFANWATLVTEPATC